MYLKRRVLVFTVLLLQITEIVHSRTKPFETADSVELVRPATGTIDAGGNGSPAMMSPNGEIGVAVLKRGDLSTGNNVFTLVSMDAKSVLDFVNNPLSSNYPIRTELITLETRAWQDGIQRLQWIEGGKKLLFLGFSRGTNDRGQIYTFDVSKNRLTQLTNHQFSVSSYSLSKNESTLVFTTEKPENWDFRKLHGYAFRSGHDLRNLTTLDPSNLPKNAYFSLSIRNGALREILPSTRRDPPSPEVHVSPEGLWAVRFDLIRTVPASWYENQVIPDAKQDLTGADDAFGGESERNTLLLQPVLMDLARGIEHNLFEAPLADTPKLAWSSDERMILVSNTYLPIEVVSPNHRTSTPAVVSVDLQDGIVSYISRSDSILDLYFETNTTACIARKLPNGSLIREAYIYRRPEHRWVLQLSSLARCNRSTHDNAEAVPRLSLRRVDNRRVPPNIEAEDRVTGKRRTILKLNPSLSEFNFGAIEAVEWVDRLGRKWSGGLLLPDGGLYRKPYPLVIQAHGFNEGRTPFEFDNSTTGYPGRLFVDKGIAVLLLSCDIGEQPQETEEKYALNPDFGQKRSITVCYEGAIDSLISRAVADPGRIGLVGFSAAGDDVFNLVTFSDKAFAAAVIVDSFQTTLWSYVQYYGFPRPGMLSWDASPSPGNTPSLIGDQFFGDGKEKWIQRSPSFSLDRIRTPLLYEHHGSDFACPCWDTFALLKRRQRPVELVHYPDGQHNLGLPLERYRSRQMLLDWFIFWLKDEEDPDPRKFQQYQRWEVLRRQHAAHLAGKEP